MDSPSGRVPERDPGWFFVAIEACDSGTPDLGLFLAVSIFIGGRSTPGEPRGPHEAGGRPIIGDRNSFRG